jgi:hypothetical protein
MRHAAAPVLTLFFALSASAGWQYKIESKTAGAMATTIVGEVRAEGPMTRTTLTSGDPFLFKKGSLIVTREKGKIIAVADPAKKSYYEIRLDDVAASTTDALRQFGGDFQIKNPSVKVRDGGDGGKLAGFATRRTIVESSYDIVTSLMGKAQTIRIETRAEHWTTAQLPDDAIHFLQLRALRTGVEQVDKLLASQPEVKGFPLKQTTDVRIVTNGREIKSSTVTTVTSVVKKAFRPSELALPAGYRKVESPLGKMLP